MSAPPPPSGKGGGARRLRLLSIAGSDPSGGAGIQADLKTFAAHGAFGLSVVTAVTAQNRRAVLAVHPLPAELVATQLDAVLADPGVDAVKIGMLGTGAIVRAVAGRLRAHLEQAASRAPWSAAGAAAAALPIVVDPVLAATAPGSRVAGLAEVAERAGGEGSAGAPLLEAGAAPVLVAELLPLATLVTPNLLELAALTGFSPADLMVEEGRLRAARALAVRGPAVLAKGGHAPVHRAGVGGGEREAARARPADSWDSEDPADVGRRADRSSGREPSERPAGGGERQPADEIVDLLVTGRGEEVWRFANPRLPGLAPHGTGCTLAAAIAASLAAGAPLACAVGGAIAYVRGAFAAAARLAAAENPPDPRPGLTVRPEGAAGGIRARLGSLDHLYWLDPLSAADRCAWQGPSGRLSGAGAGEDA